MKVITAGNKQSLFDISIQEYGDISAVFDIVAANKNISSVDDNINAGDKIKIDESMIVNKDIVKYYAMNGIKPASGI